MLRVTRHLRVAWSNLLCQINGVPQGPHSSTASLTNDHLASTEWCPPCHTAACPVSQQHNHNQILFDIFILCHFWKSHHLGMLIPHTWWDIRGPGPIESESNSIYTSSIVSVWEELNYDPSSSTISHMASVFQVFLIKHLCQ